MDSEILLDVTRLMWRAWRGRPPTGIDRVCLAYLEHYGARARLVIRRRGLSVVLSRSQSERIGRLLMEATAKVKLAVALLGALMTARRQVSGCSMLYLNAGHTGLDDPELTSWIASNRVRSIYLLHDLIPMTHPEYCRPGEDRRHARRVSNALATAHGIIANSQDTLVELERFAKLNGVIVPPTLSAWISGRLERPVSRRNEERRPYFVAVGTIEGRKNHLLLLDVWEHLADTLGEQAPELVLIGQRGWQAEEVFGRLDNPGKLTGLVREIRGCKDEDLACWVAGARALLMPSFVEGFGLPVVEALDLGTPVIASDLRALREIAGDIPTYLHPRDLAGWETTIAEFTRESPERARQLAALESYRAPTWGDHFKAVDRWLASL